MVYTWALKGLPYSNGTLRVQVPIWYILGPEKGSHIVALEPKYVLYGDMDPESL